MGSKFLLTDLNLGAISTIDKTSLQKKKQQKLVDIIQMNKVKVNVVYIFDRSGSMCGTEDDIKSGFDALKAKYSRKNVNASVVLFNYSADYSIWEQPIENVNVSYKAGGETRLYDTVIETIKKYESIHNGDNETALFILATDGEDNLSNYRKSDVAKCVKKEIDLGRHFFFMGDKISLLEDAINMGIPSENCVQFRKEANGVENLLLATSRIIDDAKKGVISDDWKTQIEDHTNKVLGIGVKRR